MADAVHGERGVMTAQHLSTRTRVHSHGAFKRTPNDVNAYRRSLHT
jgi:hypothetical protein